MEKKYILVTGGGGYIGSHLVIKLLRKNYNIVVIDNYSNCPKDIKKTILKKTNKDFFFFNLNLNNFKSVKKIFIKFNIQTIFHLAGFKSVQESIKFKKKYFLNNVKGFQNLMKAVDFNKLENIIFSSSAAVYSRHSRLPIKETAKIKILSPYAENKIFIENIIFKLQKKKLLKNAISLRYFNPAGSLIKSFKKKNDVKYEGIFLKLIDSINKNFFFEIYGKNYNSKDKTCVRDFIHISDLVSGHIAALKYVKKNSGSKIFNLGSGKENTILEVVKCFEKTLKRKVLFKFKDRRIGDIPKSLADIEKSKKFLYWKPKKKLIDICKTYIKD